MKRCNEKADFFCRIQRGIECGKIDEEEDLNYSKKIMFIWGLFFFNFINKFVKHKKFVLDRFELLTCKKTNNKHLLSQAGKSET